MVLDRHVLSCSLEYPFSDPLLLIFGVFRTQKALIKDLFTEFTRVALKRVSEGSLEYLKFRERSSQLLFLLLAPSGDRFLDFRYARRR